MMPRAVERIMRGNGERERMGESIVGESSRTFNEVYVTSLRYTDPLGQLLTLYLVIGLITNTITSACIQWNAIIITAMRVPTCAIQSETIVSVSQVFAASRKT